MAEKTPISVAYGNGIGPEIMAAALSILEGAGADLEIREVEIGEKVYNKGQKSGIAPETWDIIRGTKAFLKAPITTPQGGGFKSLNVTVRTALGLYANVRPCVSYAPFIETKFPNMDVVIIRENEEDLYAGIEYRQSQDVTHALKIISRPGCERIIRYAFDYAKSNNRQKVTCFTKDNILKLTDGLFHKIFEEIAQEYPEINHEHWIVDIGAAKLATAPQEFDVVVMPNLYGDILSDVTAQMTGSVGLAGSANIGEHTAMFEAIHGSAPRHAGQNSANPSGLILASVLMLIHLGQPSVAGKIHNAWLKTIEDGFHTYDIYKDTISKEKAGTAQFAEAVIQRLGQHPEILKPVHYQEGFHQSQKPYSSKHKKVEKRLVGVDVFFDWKEDEESLHKTITHLDLKNFSLTMIGNRGVKVWPHKIPETNCVDEWRCRFQSHELGSEISHQDIAHLLQRFAEKSLDYTHIENLYKYDGVAGYTLAQDEQ